MALELHIRALDLRSRSWPRCCGRVGLYFKIIVFGRRRLGAEGEALRTRSPVALGDVISGECELED